jgi:hypothetical protein
MANQPRPNMQGIASWNASLMIAAGTYPGTVCGAKLKRGLGFCKRPAVKGSMRCHLHGGRTPRKSDPPRNLTERQMDNRSIRRGRAALAADVAAQSEQDSLHPETMPLYARDFAHRVQPDLTNYCISMLSARLKGDISAAEWRGVLIDVLDDH